MKLFLVLMLTSLTAFAAAPAKPAVIPSVTIQGTTYSNVVVIDSTASSVMIQHARGMASFNADRLTAAEKQQLSGGPPVKAAPEPEAAPKKPAPSEPVADTNAQDRVKWNLPSKFEVPTREQFRQLLKDAPPIQGPVLIGLIVGYLFLGFCFTLICNKAGKPSSLLVWIPLVQMYPLFKAAAMSAAWFRLMLVNLIFQLAVLQLTGSGMMSPLMATVCTMITVGLSLITVIGWIIWSFKICIARDKSPALGIFLILPCTNIFALAYLAFSK